MLGQYDPARHRKSAHRFGQDHSVACACYLALGLWHLGFPEQARQYSDRAIEYARSLGHAHTLQFALAYGGAYFAAHCRDADYLDATTSELVELGKAHSSRSWSAALTGLLGMLLIERGRTRDGIVGLRTGLEALREFNSMLWQPAFCSWLARAYATCGEVSQGFAAIDMGRQVAAGGRGGGMVGGGGVWEGEGWVPSRAEECLRQSLAAAQRHSHRAFWSCGRRSALRGFGGGKDVGTRRWRRWIRRRLVHGRARQRGLARSRGTDEGAAQSRAFVGVHPGSHHAAIDQRRSVGMQFASYHHSGSPGSVCGACLHSWRSAIDDFQRGTSVLLPERSEALTAQSERFILTPLQQMPGRSELGELRLFGSRPFQPSTALVLAPEAGRSRRRICRARRVESGPSRGERKGTDDAGSHAKA